MRRGITVGRHTNDPLEASPSMSIPIGRAVFCVDCEAIFALGSATCPSCAGRMHVTLERFFRGRDRKLVRAEDVMDRVEEERPNAG